LAGLVNLKKLNLEKNQISDLSPLAGLTQLVNLQLRYNQIGDLTPLAGLTNLENLDISYNRISDLTPLQGLNHLQILDFRNNRVSDLSPLANLTRLRSICFDYNQVSDLSPIVRLYDAGGLREKKSVIYLAENPLTNEAFQEDIPYLQKHGVSVSGLKHGAPRYEPVTPRQVQPQTKPPPSDTPFIISPRVRKRTP